MEVTTINQFWELVAENGFQTMALVVVGLYLKNTLDDFREDTKRREEESRLREDTLISKIQTVNDTNRDLANIGAELTRTNSEIAQTNSLLAKDMKEGLCNINDKLDSILQKE